MEGTLRVDGPHQLAHALALAGLALSMSRAPGVPAPALLPPADSLPTVRANDNRRPAGSLRDGVLTLRLVVRMARWYPEDEGGPSVVAAAFAEEGRAPQIPAPLIRVPAGTVLAITVRNALPDSAVSLHGLRSRTGAASPSAPLRPGESRTLRFTAGAPGTYLYLARLGAYVAPENPLDVGVEREQLGGAFVVDSAGGGGAADRIFVINVWGDDVDSTRYRNALTINGRSWPHTERLSAAVGDSVRWRVVNASARPHPMHLHGFYFRVDARGDLRRDTAYAPEARRLAVTEQLRPFTTMRLVWTPTRPGNWIFHCHLAFHVVPGTRLEPPTGDAARLAHLAHDPGQHMAGLVLGVAVREGKRWADSPRGPARALRLHVTEGRPRGRAPRALGFVLQLGAASPAADSVLVPGSLLVLTRGEPTDVTVVNGLREATSVHWHGIELESYSDGVAGWSGAADRLAPLIAPRDSFVARLTLPRAGTFIYHTHLNDLEQLTSGLYGAIVVLEPGQRFDPATDHVFVAGWDGEGEPAHVLVNGDSLPPPLVLAAGIAHRLRFVNIGLAGLLTVSLLRENTPVDWRALAKDGADLPTAQATRRRATQTVAVGETYDFELTAPAPGEYLLRITAPVLPSPWMQRVVVR
jgi:FtsP/CotA-like multicopper oxidase with cupredoxin domain